MQGRSLHTLLDGEEYREREAVFTEQNFNAWTDVSRAVVTRRYKLIANFSPGRAFFDSSQTWRPETEVSFIENAAKTYHPPLELYDLTADPLETTNLADNPGNEDVFVGMKQKLYRWMQETEDPLLDGPPVPPIYRRTMRSLVRSGKTPPRTTRE